MDFYADTDEVARQGGIDPEAHAYSDCVQALQRLPRIPHDAIFAMYVGQRDYQNTAAIQRVLLALSERFDAGLMIRPAPPTPPEPEVCDECGQEVD